MNSIEGISNLAAFRGVLRPRTFFAVLLAAATLCGCAQRYDMALTNGGSVINVRKPKLSPDGGRWSFITANGKTNFIPAGRVTSVYPHGSKEGQFVTQ